jgi:hypothetical protein
VTRAAPAADDASVRYGVEGVTEAGETAPAEKRPKPTCFSCNGRGKVKVFRVWTAVLGENVEVQDANGEVVRAPSYRDVVEHEAPVCRACVKRASREHGRWLLWTALGQFVVLVLLLAVLLVLFLVKLQPTSEGGQVFIWLAVTVVGCVISLAGTLIYYFSRRTFDKAEAAVAHALFRELDPGAEVGLSLKQFQALEPQQIIGEPRKATSPRRPRSGPARPRRRP